MRRVQRWEGLQELPRRELLLALARDYHHLQNVHKHAAPESSTSAGSRSRRALAPRAAAPADARGLALAYSLVSAPLLSAPVGSSTKISAAMSGSRCTWDMKAITLRPVISSTASLNGPRMAIWKDCRVALT